MKIYIFKTGMIKFFIISSSIEKATLTFLEEIYLFNPFGFNKTISYCFDEVINEFSIIDYTNSSVVVEKSYSIAEIEIEEGVIFS